MACINKGDVKYNLAWFLYCVLLLFLVFIMFICLFDCLPFPPCRVILIFLKELNYPDRQQIVAYKLICFIIYLQDLVILNVM